jgi:hypothetical protein
MVYSGVRMTRSRRLGLPLAALLSVLAPAARAQTASIANGSWFQFDGLVFSISGCTYNGGSCASDGGLMAASTSANGAVVDFQASGGGNLLSAAARAAPPALNFTLNVWNAAPGGTLSYAAATLTGSVAKKADTGDLADVFALFNTYGNQYEVVATPGYQTVSANFPAMAFTSANPLSVSLSLGLNTSQATSGDTLNLHDVAMTFGPAVPEPASLAVFGVGLVGVAVARLRARRR